MSLMTKLPKLDARVMITSGMRSRKGRDGVGRWSEFVTEKYGFLECGWWNSWEGIQEKVLVDWRIEVMEWQA